MKILILSDSHGRLDALRTAVEREQPERVFHLGDVLGDARGLAKIFPDLPIDMVAGNCDGGVDDPAERTVTVEGVKFLLTHGHRYWVKLGTGKLRSRAEEEGANMVCFGHTHEAQCRMFSGGLWMVNPGTVGGIGAQATYAVAWAENGTVKAELRKL